MTDAPVRGRFLWYELMTSDTEAAQKFYAPLIEWGTQAWEGEMPYTMWMKDDVSVGGLMTLPEDAKKAGAPPNWAAYVGTPDVDATAKQANRLGATVLVPPTDIPNVGRFSVISDPQGAVINAFTPTGDESRQPLGPGGFSWHELATTDYEAAFRFYHELFGWEKQDAVDMGGGMIYQMYGLTAADVPLGGMFNKPPEIPRPFWLYYIMVDDVNRRAKHVEKLGGKILNGPMEVPGGDLIVQCMDPQGAMFALHSKAAQ
jgi:hypothetical protein